MLTDALEWLDTRIAAFLGCYQDAPKHSGTMQVDLRLDPRSEQDVVSNSQTYRIQLPELREDFYFLWDPSNLDGVLDAIFPTDVPLCMAPKPGLYDLSSYEVCSQSQINLLTLTGKPFQRLCRRLCACISLLRRPNECTLSQPHMNDYRILHLVVGILCQLARTASSTIAEIFEHIRGCCFANRDRRGTPNLMFILAENLGHMHAEIRCFIDVKGGYPDPVHSF